MQESRKDVLNIVEAMLANKGTKHIVTTGWWNNFFVDIQFWQFELPLICLLPERGHPPKSVWMLTLTLGEYTNRNRTL